MWSLVNPTCVSRYHKGITRALVSYIQTVDIAHKSEVPVEDELVEQRNAKRIDVQRLEDIKLTPDKRYQKKVENLCEQGPVVAPDSLYDNPLIRQGVAHVQKDALLRNTKMLRNYLWSRQPPTEQAQLQETADKVDQHLMSLTQERMDLEKELQQISDQKIIAEKELKLGQLEERREKLASKILRQKLYHWKAIDYNAATSVTYMFALVESHYAVVYRILQEIRKIDDKFEPKSLINFGSGTGSSVWAAMQHWKTISHAYLWDISESMLFISKELLRHQRIDSGKTAASRCDFGKNEHSQKTKFDLVISAYSLFELRNKQARLNIIEKLWKYTANRAYLVLVENGTQHGHALIQEARQHIIKNFAQGETDGKEEAHIFSPCPHMKKCPRSQADSRVPCNFLVEYNQMIQHSSESKIESRKGSHQADRTLYSYVVFKKSAQPDLVYPRALYNLTKVNGSITATACFPDGEIKSATLHSSSSSRKKSLNKLLLKRRGLTIPIVNSDDGTIK